MKALTDVEKAKYVFQAYKAVTETGNNYSKVHTYLRHHLAGNYSVSRLNARNKTKLDKLVIAAHGAMTDIGIPEYADKCKTQLLALDKVEF